MIRLLVVDDHKLVRKCLCAKLESVPDFRVVGEAESGERARQLARETLAFFQGPVFDHHREEEKDLFPAVLAHAQPGVELGQVEAMVDELVAEHREIEGMWRQLQPQLELVARGAEVAMDLRRAIKDPELGARGGGAPEWVSGVVRGASVAPWLRALGEAL